ncbi:glutamyl-tRNA reductase [Dermabacter sp. p3-SID358]|uniref:glutamyl-tRNA reductase n=1 Tax=Dermabacter sp. p3-SID358 TaxID=2916114 RepID=UPI0021A4BBE3|nr:glutamyl-tRNA reductase [Dermabacter sp. p3-SID358]MCT1866893.1 glutamyl-tRNA reductase [Dermabacter sp. p3-SID358]
MLIALRATHDNLGLEGLERITRGSENLDARLAALNEAHPEQPLTGWVCLATCNRLEVYADVDRFHDAIDLVTRAVTDTSGLPPEEVARMLLVDAGSISARHMYEVASGMNSQVLGEAEITGQVRMTFSSALASGHTTTLLNDLFQGALRTAKQVSSKTKVGAAGRSSVAVALDSAHLFTTELEGREALLIGTGALARVASAELHRRGVGTLRVYSPSGRARQFADSHGATPVAPEELEAALSRATVVIAASGGGTHVIDSVTLERALEARATSEELVILDLALHADVDPAAAALPGVRVLVLESIRAGESARGEVERARELIDTGVVRFEERQQIRAVDPAVSALRRSVKDMIVVEVEEVRRSAGDAAAEQVQRSLGRVYNKLLHSPMVRAQELAKTGQADQFLGAVHTIFGVDVTGTLSVDGAGQASDPEGPGRDGLERPPMSVAKMEQMRRELEAAREGEAQEGAEAEKQGGNHV